MLAYWKAFYRLLQRTANMPQSSEPTRSDAPFADIAIVPYKAASSEVIQLGGVRLDILEDGRNTDQRIGALIITLQPHTAGPPEHYHQVCPSTASLEN